MFGGSGNEVVQESVENGIRGRIACLVEPSPAIDPGRRVEFTFQARWDPDLAKDGAAREVWIVEPQDEFTEMKVEIYDLAPGSKTVVDFTEGFSELISGMKTVLEPDSLASLTEEAQALRRSRR